MIKPGKKFPGQTVDRVLQYYFKILKTDHIKNSLSDVMKSYLKKASSFEFAELVKSKCTVIAG